MADFIEAIVDVVAAIVKFLFNLIINLICLVVLFLSFIAPWRIFSLPGAMGHFNSKESSFQTAFRICAFAMLGTSILDILTLPAFIMPLCTWRIFHHLWGWARVFSLSTSEEEKNVWRPQIRVFAWMSLFSVFFDVLAMFAFVFQHLVFWRLPRLYSAIAESYGKYGFEIIPCTLVTTQMSTYGEAKSAFSDSELRLIFAFYGLQAAVDVFILIITLPFIFFACCSWRVLSFYHQFNFYACYNESNWAADPRSAWYINYQGRFYAWYVVFILLPTDMLTAFCFVFAHVPFWRVGAMYRMLAFKYEQHGLDLFPYTVLGRPDNGGVSTYPFYDVSTFNRDNPSASKLQAQPSVSTCCGNIYVNHFDAFIHLQYNKTIIVQGFLMSWFYTFIDVLMLPVYFITLLGFWRLPRYLKASYRAFSIFNRTEDMRHLRAQESNSVYSRKHDLEDDFESFCWDFRRITLRVAFIEVPLDFLSFPAFVFSMCSWRVFHFWHQASYDLAVFDMAEMVRERKAEKALPGILASNKYYVAEDPLEYYCLELRLHVLRIAFVDIPLDILTALLFAISHVVFWRMPRMYMRLYQQVRKVGTCLYPSSLINGSPAVFYKANRALVSTFPPLPNATFDPANTYQVASMALLRVPEINNEPALTDAEVSSLSCCSCVIASAVDCSCFAAQTHTTDTRLFIMYEIFLKGWTQFVVDLLTFTPFVLTLFSWRGIQLVTVINQAIDFDNLSDTTGSTDFSWSARAVVWINFFHYLIDIPHIFMLFFGFILAPWRAPLLYKSFSAMFNTYGTALLPWTQREYKKQYFQCYYPTYVDPVDGMWKIDKKIAEREKNNNNNNNNININNNDNNNTKSSVNMTTCQNLLTTSEQQENQKTSTAATISVPSATAIAALTDPKLEEHNQLLFARQHEFTYTVESKYRSAIFTNFVSSIAECFLLYVCVLPFVAPALMPWRLFYLFHGYEICCFSSAKSSSTTPELTTNHKNSPDNQNTTGTSSTTQIKTEQQQQEERRLENLNKLNQSAVVIKNLNKELSPERIRVERYFPIWASGFYSLLDVICFALFIISHLSIIRIPFLYRKLWREFSTKGCPLLPWTLKQTKKKADRIRELQRKALLKHDERDKILAIGNLDQYGNNNNNNNKSTAGSNGDSAGIPEWETVDTGYRFILVAQALHALLELILLPFLIIMILTYYRAHRIIALGRIASMQEELSEELEAEEEKAEERVAAFRVEQTVHRFELEKEEKEKQQNHSVVTPSDDQKKNNTNNNKNDDDDNNNNASAVSGAIATRQNNNINDPSVSLTHFDVVESPRKDAGSILDPSFIPLPIITPVEQKLFIVYEILHMLLDFVTAFFAVIVFCSLLRTVTYVNDIIDILEENKADEVHLSKEGAEESAKHKGTVENTKLSMVERQKIIKKQYFALEDFENHNMSWVKLTFYHAFLLLRDFIFLPFALVVLATLYRGFFLITEVKRRVARWANVNKSAIKIDRIYLEKSPKGRETGFVFRVVGTKEADFVISPSDAKTISFYIRGDEWFWSEIGRSHGGMIATLGESMMPLNIKPEYFDATEQIRKGETEVNLVFDFDISNKTSSVLKNILKISPNATCVIQIEYGNHAGTLFGAKFDMGSCSRALSGCADFTTTFSSDPATGVLTATAALPVSASSTNHHHQTNNVINNIAASLLNDNTTATATTTIPSGASAQTAAVAPAPTVVQRKSDPYEIYYDRSFQLGNFFKKNEWRGEKFTDVWWPIALMQFGLFLLDLLTLTAFLLLHIFPHRVIALYSQACESKQRRKNREFRNVIDRIQAEVIDEFPKSVDAIISSSLDTIKNSAANYQFQLAQRSISQWYLEWKDRIEHSFDTPLRQRGAEDLIAPQLKELLLEHLDFAAEFADQLDYTCKVKFGFGPTDADTDRKKAMDRKQKQQQKKKSNAASSSSSPNQQQQHKDQTRKPESDQTGFWASAKQFFLDTLGSRFRAVTDAVGFEYHSFAQHAADIAELNPGLPLSLFFVADTYKQPNNTIKNNEKVNIAASNPLSSEGAAVAVVVNNNNTSNNQDQEDQDQDDTIIKHERKLFELDIMHSRVLSERAHDLCNRSNAYLADVITPQLEKQGSCCDIKGADGVTGFRLDLLGMWIELIKDIPPLICFAFVACTLIRLPWTLWQLWKHPRMPRRICYIAFCEFWADIAYFILFCLSCIGIRAIFAVPYDLVRVLWYYPSYASARHVVAENWSLIFRDIFRLLKMIITCDTIKFLLAACVFGALAPGVLIEGAFVQGNSDTNVCRAGLVLLLGLFLMFGLPFILGKSESVFEDPSTPGLVFFVVIGAFYLISVLITLCLKSDVVVTLRRPIVKTARPNWHNLSNFFWIVIELIQIFALCFGALATSNSTVFDSASGNGFSTTETVRNVANYIFILVQRPGSNSTSTTLVTNETTNVSSNVTIDNVVSPQVPIGAPVALSLLVFYFILSTIPIVTGYVLKWPEGRKLRKTTAYGTAMKILGFVFQLTIVRNVAEVLACTSTPVNGIVGTMRIQPDLVCFKNDSHAFFAMPLMVFTMYYLISTLAHNVIFDESDAARSDIILAEFYRMLVNGPMVAATVCVALLNNNNGLSNTAAESAPAALIILAIASALGLFFSLIYGRFINYATGERAFCTLRIIELFKIALYFSTFVCAILCLVGAAIKNRSSDAGSQLWVIWVSVGVAVASFGAAYVWAHKCIPKYADENSLDEVRQDLLEIEEQYVNEDKMIPAWVEMRKAWRDRVETAVRVSTLAASAVFLESGINALHMQNFYITSRFKWTQEVQKMIDDTDKQDDGVFGRHNNITQRLKEAARGNNSDFDSDAGDDEFSAGGGCSSCCCCCCCSKNDKCFRCLCCCFVGVRGINGCADACCCCFRYHRSCRVVECCIYGCFACCDDQRNIFKESSVSSGEDVKEALSPKNITLLNQIVQTLRNGVIKQQQEDVAAGQQQQQQAAEGVIDPARHNFPLPIEYYQNARGTINADRLNDFDGEEEANFDHLDNTTAAAAAAADEKKEKKITFHDSDSDGNGDVVSTWKKKPAFSESYSNAPDMHAANNNNNNNNNKNNKKNDDDEYDSEPDYLYLGTLPADLDRSVGRALQQSLKRIYIKHAVRTKKITKTLTIKSTISSLISQFGGEAAQVFPSIVAHLNAEFGDEKIGSEFFDDVFNRLIDANPENKNINNNKNDSDKNNKTEKNKKDDDDHDDDAKEPPAPGALTEEFSL